MLKRISTLLIIFILTGLEFALSQPVDSISFKLNTRYSFYSYERSAEMLLLVPQNLIYNKTEASLSSGNKIIGTWKGIPGKQIVRMPFDLNSNVGTFRITAGISVTGKNVKYVVAWLVQNYQVFEKDCIKFRKRPVIQRMEQIQLALPIALLWDR